MLKYPAISSSQIMYVDHKYIRLRAEKIRSQHIQSLTPFLVKTLAKRIFDIIRNLSSHSCTKIKGSIQNYCLTSKKQYRRRAAVQMTDKIWVRSLSLIVKPKKIYCWLKAECVLVSTKINKSK